jgi:hypothetical protein
MTKISKLFVGILFSALLVSPSYAGEMTVTGGATATYATNGDDASAGKNLGISNELDFTATGELDNGFTWKYQVQLDGATAANDDTRLEIGTDMGTIGLYVSEGGLSSELAHGVGAMGVGFDYVSPSSFVTSYDVDGYSNIQYHTPAGLLPFGGSVKIGYVPNMNATSLSAKESVSDPASAATGSSLEMIQLKVAPVDGLAIQGSAAQTEGATGLNGSGGREQGVGANIGAKYTIGQITAGYTQGGKQAAVASGELTYYENKYIGIQFDVNDSLSVSYNRDESEKTTRAAVASGATTGTKSAIKMEQDSIQVAYTTGGATIGITQVEVDNADYTTSKKEEQTVVSLGISF